jgi:type IV secretory pathway TrbD component
MNIPEKYCSPFRPSANRPHLLLGCEPTPLLLAFVVALLIGWSFMTWWGVGLAALLFFFLRMLLREMAKADPYLTTVHAEAQRYNQNFWTAKPWRPSRWKV